MPQEANSRRPKQTDRPNSPAGRSSRSRRRRRRRLDPLLYLLLVVAASAILSGIAWVLAGDVLALNKEPHSAIITLAAGSFSQREVTSTAADGTVSTYTVNDVDINYVTDLLAENGLIEYKPLFKLFCAFTGVKKKGKITPGTYELNTDMDYNALVNSMSSSSGSRMTVSVTIPEGYTVDQIFALLQEKGVATEELLQDVAANHDFKFSFLKDVLPLGDYHRLEGYLFPDTYEFYMGGGTNAVIQILNKMILRFDQQFPDALREKAAAMGYTVHQMVTIASLIEKETDGTDQTKIASVIYNRLERPTNETVGLLQIDAAIAYVTGRPVSQSDYQEVDSPYNTYLNQGLPPGPISNPGMVALNSALNPDSTGYYYYVLDPETKRHEFSRNYDAHQQLVQRYSNG